MTRSASSLLVEVLGAGWSLGQDEVAHFGARVPHPHLDVAAELGAELAEHGAWLGDRPRPVGEALVPDRWQAEQRPRVARAQRAHDEVVHAGRVLDDPHVVAFGPAIPSSAMAAVPSASRRALKPDRSTPGPPRGHRDAVPCGARRLDERVDGVRAGQAALGEAGRTSTDAVDAFVEHLEHRMGPHHGARVVARAWVDPAFKERLLADGTAAMAELGIAGAEGDNVRVVENTEQVHNLVVCTLCSCYPWPLLGVPPTWYKSSRIVRGRSPSRARVLAEFGCRLADDVEIRVWDSSAAIRYLVLPIDRPAPSR